MYVNSAPNQPMRSVKETRELSIDVLSYDKNSQSKWSETDGINSSSMHDKVTQSHPYPHPHTHIHTHTHACV